MRYAAELDALPRRPQRYELLFVSFPAAEVLVTGYADRCGTSDFNMVLSIRRADAVRHLLIAAGLDAARVQSLGRGDLELAVNQAPGVSESRNRRVEIKLR